MADTILGTLTIGQAPRPDITPILDRYVPTSVKRIHRGLLDGLSRDEIAGAYAAKAGEAVLVTRLSDGSSVQLSAQKVHSALQGRLDALEADGCNIVLLLCTGAFGGLHLKRGFLLEPDRIIPPTVAGLARDRQLGILVPVASQITSESDKWKALERPPIFAAASPYTDTVDVVTASGVSLVRRGAEALLLDCIGFVEAHRRQLAHASGPSAAIHPPALRRSAGLRCVLIVWEQPSFAEGLIRLASKPVLLVAIAGREVEGDKSGNACSLCDGTGLTRGEMSPLCSNFGIHVEERRLHKELISPARQRDDPIDVLFVVGSVDHISDLLSTRCPQRVLLEHAEGNGLVGANDDFTVVRRISPHRSLRVAEPWADGKPEQL